MSKREKNTRSRTAAAVLLASLPFAAAVAPAQDMDDVRASSIVFVGTVEQVGAVALPGLTASPATSVVAVEEVYKKPEGVSLVPGARVTVLTDAPGDAKAGERAVYYAEGWIFGEGLAVRQLARKAAPATLAPGAARAEMAAQLQAAKRAELMARVERAHVVVVGRVKKVSAPTMAALVATPQAQFVSEHNPDWQEAVVEVQSSLKGAEGMNEVVLRFPRSMDVQWHEYPKFEEGQEGTFLLEQDPVSGTPTAMLGATEVSAFMASSAAHVLDKGMAEEIRAMMKEPK